MSYRTYCFLALAAALPAVAQPSADQILAKYTLALGGEEACRKISSRSMKGTVEIPDDNVTGTAQILSKAPGSFRLSLDIPGYGIVETVYDGTSGWEKNPDSGIHAMSKTDLAIAQRDRDFYREIRLKDLYPKMSPPAAEKVEGHDVYVLEATPAAGPPEKLYFDKQTGLLVKRDFERVTLEDGIVQYEMLLRDYRDVDGVKLPFQIEQRAPDNTMIFKFTEIQNNAPLEAAAFAKPEK